MTERERLAAIAKEVGNHMSDGAWAMFHELFKTIESLEARIERLESGSLQPPEESNE